MSSGTRIISKLEKMKAALGAAGMAAVACEALGPRIFGEAFTGFAGNAIPIAAALLSGITASYYTEVSGREATLESEAAKESIMTNASGQ